MDSRLNRRGFLGALGALTALVVATPLAARTVRKPPAALTEAAPPVVVGGAATDMATVAFIFRKVYGTAMVDRMAMDASRAHPLLEGLRRHA